MARLALLLVGLALCASAVPSLCADARWPARGTWSLYGDLQRISASTQLQAEPGGAAPPDSEPVPPTEIDAQRAEQFVTGVLDSAQSSVVAAGTSNGATRAQALAAYRTLRGFLVDNAAPFGAILNFALGNADLWAREQGIPARPAPPSSGLELTERARPHSSPTCACSPTSTDSIRCAAAPDRPRIKLLARPDPSSRPPQAIFVGLYGEGIRIALSETRGNLPAARAMVIALERAVVEALWQTLQRSGPTIGGPLASPSPSPVVPPEASLEEIEFAL
eukprot:tig00020629_g12335.t1